MSDMATGRDVAPKLSYPEFKDMLMDPDVPDSDIAVFLTADAVESKPFNPAIVPDPAKVDMTPEGEFDVQVESAIRWGNSVSRWRRQARFERRIARGERKPVIVSEGDSYFQFPFLIEDIVDHLNSEFLIWSLDAAGDTAENMVNRRPEYMEGLRKQKANGVSAFLFSAAGNDVIGEDLLGEPVLGALLKPFQSGKSASWHIDTAQLASILSRLEVNYRKVMSTIRSDDSFRSLPIFIHGYDYAIPGGYTGDNRNPIYAKQDEWLGGPMKKKNITEPQLQRDIIRILIDALYDMLEKVAGRSADTNIHVVNLRGTLSANEWADEIHGTSAGFAKMARRFSNRIRGVI